MNNFMFFFIHFLYFSQLSKSIYITFSDQGQCYILRTTELTRNANVPTKPNTVLPLPGLLWKRWTRLTDKTDCVASREAGNNRKLNWRISPQAGLALCCWDHQIHLPTEDKERPNAHLGTASGSEILITLRADGFLSKRLPHQAETNLLTHVC